MFRIYYATIYNSELWLPFDVADDAFAFAEAFKKSSGWKYIEILEHEEGRGYVRSLMYSEGPDF